MTLQHYELTQTRHHKCPGRNDLVLGKAVWRSASHFVKFDLLTPHKHGGLAF